MLLRISDRGWAADGARPVSSTRCSISTNHAHLYRARHETSMSWYLEVIERMLQRPLLPSTAPSATCRPYPNVLPHIRQHELNKTRNERAGDRGLCCNGKGVRCILLNKAIPVRLHMGTSFWDSNRGKSLMKDTRCLRNTSSTPTPGAATKKRHRRATR